MTTSIGRVGRNVVNWKGWKGRRSEGLEGTSDSDVVAGMVGFVVNCKGWIRTLLLIVPIDVVVDC